MTLRTLVTAGLTILTLAACTGTPATNTAAGPSPTPSSNQAAAIRLAECMRANGFPTFPDPVKDDRGRWSFPPESTGDWLPPEPCRPLVRDWKVAFSDVPPASAEDLAKTRDYVTCMREHGFPDFPDPDEDGNIELTDRFRVLADTDDAAFIAAHEACKHHLPPKPMK
ncbi:hypothetical protein GCM10009827_073800 [Dactylosporangium maewongense]|uniref:Lipoprotein n=1 Tax=Dactylosporangium maewongense TaxID=634393 RepID=A0ABN2BM84_9ACTN